MNKTCYSQPRLTAAHLPLCNQEKLCDGTPEAAFHGPRASAGQRRYLSCVICAAVAP